MVGAQLAGGGLGLVGEGGQGLGREEGGALQSSLLGGQGSSVGPHDAGDGGAGDLPPDLPLEGAEDRIVEKGAPLDHDVLAQVVGVGRPDHLIDGVAHHRDGQACGDVLHRGPVLLGLLHRGVHEHGAPGTQVHRVLGQKAHFGEVSDVVSQGLGKGLHEGTAARGAGLVQ